MAEETVNTIIDNLCTKFGTTLQNLIPEMAKANIAENIVTIIIFGILSIVIYKLYKKYSKINEYSDYDFQIILTIAFGIIFAILLLLSTIDLTGWIASPTAKTIQAIISMVN